MASDEDVAAAILTAHAHRGVLDPPAGADHIADDRAYAVQGLVVAARLARGERVVGWKLGYTSEVMRQQMGIADPNFGPLTDAMILSSPAIAPDTLTQPRVEPEIALVVGEVSVGGAIAVRAAYGALEVVDSVWRDYSFTWAENTADGSSAAYVVLGPELELGDLAAETVELQVGERAVAAGTGAAAMGDPLAALAWLGAQLAGHPRGLLRGDIVITGGLTAAVPLGPGDRVSATFRAGQVSVTRAQDGMAAPGVGALTT